MAVLTQTQIADEIKDLIVGSAATDPPATAAEIQRATNRAYALVWEMQGGRIKKVASATAWTSANLATGIVAGILTDINTVTQVFASTTSGSTGFSSGDTTLVPVDYAYIQSLRRGDGGFGSYARPQVYSIIDLATSSPASVNLKELHYYPSVTGFYLPIHYVAQFVPLDGGSVTTPDTNDLGSYDIAYLAAMDLAVLTGKAHLVAGIDMKLSEGMRLFLERKAGALTEGKQDK